MYVINFFWTHLKAKKELVLLKKYCFSQKNTVLIIFMTAPMNSPKKVLIITVCPPYSPRNAPWLHFQVQTEQQLANHFRILRRSNKSSRRLTELFWCFIQWIPSVVGGWCWQWMIVVGSMDWGMMMHTSNWFFLLFYSSEKTLPFQHIFVPLVEEESVSIVSDESNGSGSYSEVEDLQCPSYTKTH